jgi:hypothetical protein
MKKKVIKPSCEQSEYKFKNNDEKEVRKNESYKQINIASNFDKKGSK